MRHAMLLLALITAFAKGAAAQQYLLPVQTGDRVKLAAHAGEPMQIASVIAVRPEAISIAYLGNESQAIDRPFAGIDSIRVSQGASRGASARYGAAIGAFFIGGAALVTAPLAAKSMEWGVGQAMLSFGAAGAFTGGSLGAMIGSLTPRERWKTYVIRRYDEVASRQ